MPMPESEPIAGDLKLVGGAPCLDFVNTVAWHASDQPQELLTEYEALVLWSARAGLLDADAAKALLTEAAGRPAAARAALKRARELRECLYRLFVTVIRGQAPDASDLSQFNAALSSAMRRVRLVPARDGFAWDWERGQGDLDAMLWPILRSAAELLVSERRSRLGQCADDRGCGWLFLDTTRNRSRRWCEMEDCGNRAKARRHYRRTRRRRDASSRRAERSGGFRP